MHLYCAEAAITGCITGLARPSLRLSVAYRVLTRDQKGIEIENRNGVNVHRTGVTAGCVDFYARQQELL